MRVSWDIIMRMMRGSGKGRLYSAVTMLGITIAVAALLLTLTIVEGFLHTYRDGLLAMQAPVMIVRPDEAIDVELIEASVAALPGSKVAYAGVHAQLKRYHTLRSYWYWSVQQWHRFALAMDNVPLLSDLLWYAAPQYFVAEHAPPRWLLQQITDYRDEIAPLQLGVNGPAMPFLYREMLLSAGGSIRGVMLRGIKTQDLLSNAQLPLQSTLSRAALSARLQHMDPQPAVVMGAALWRELGEPTEVQLYMPQRAGADGIGLRTQAVAAQVLGHFRSGLHEYDSQFLFADLKVLQALSHCPSDLRARQPSACVLPDTHDGGPLTGYEVRTRWMEQASSVADALQVALGPDYDVSDWQSRNALIFAALKLERLLFGLVMGLLVLVAACNILASSLINILQRYRSIATLRALGMPEHRVRRLFFWQGFAVGAGGTLLGLLVGSAAALMINHFEWIHVDPSIYFVSTIPAALTWPLLVSVAMGALLLSAVAARRAARAVSELPILRALGRGYAV